MLEETHHPVHVFQAGAAGGDDDGQVALGDAFEQRPILEVAARDFDEVVPVLFDFGDGELVPGGTHAQKAVLDDGVLELFSQGQSLHEIGAQRQQVFA